MSYGAPLRICAKKLPDEPYEIVTELPVSFWNRAPISLSANVKSAAAAMVISPAFEATAGVITNASKVIARIPQPRKLRGLILSPSPRSVHVSRAFDSVIRRDLCHYSGEVTMIMANSGRWFAAPSDGAG